MILDTSSVAYLTPRIESNQLFDENKHELAFNGSFVKIPTTAETVPVIQTIGNGIVYLNGTAEVTAGIGLGDIILTDVPYNLRPAETKHFSGVYNTNGIYSVVPFLINTEGEIKSMSALAFTVPTQDFIYLQGAFYMLR